jgi:hypothetical protein
VDRVSRCTTSYLLAGPACLGCLVKMFALQIPLKEGIGGERRPKDRVNTEDRVTLRVTLLHQGFQNGMYHWKGT